MDDDQTRLSVGQLADAVGVTAKALRHYDRIGLFRPDEVDEDNGYRWYAADRVGHARLIARLRAVGVPLDALAACLAADGAPAVIDRALREHQRRLESRLARVRGDLHQVGHLLDGGLSAPDLPRPAPPALPETPPAPARPAQVADERQLAVDLFNGVWALLSTEDRTTAQDDRMLHMAHASRHHWERTGSPANLARGEWQCSRVYAVLRRPEPCLHHAQRVLELCQKHRIGDWDLAYAYEALARAHAVAGDEGSARDYARQALATAEDIADPEDRTLLLGDLETIPGYRDRPPGVVHAT